MFKKVQTKKVFQNVLEQITGMLVEGKLVPGDILPPERELADQLGVSRPSLREALRILQVLGIIKNSPKKGTEIQHANPEQILQTLSLVLVTSSSETLQLLEVRKSLETEIAYYAAIRRSQEDLELMDNIIQQFHEATEHQELVSLDYDFHYAIAGASNNIIFKQIFEMISTMIHKEMANTRKKLFIMGSYDKILDQHRSVLNAIRDCDAEGAKLYMKTHLEFAEWELRKTMEKPI
jgi:GntR family transcriptional repressor for pyruvate dehydrogenase complex